MCTLFALSQLKFCGQPILRFKPYYANMIHQAIFFSYAGECSLCMVLDSTNMPRGAELMDECFREELAAALAEYK
jgi:hypothetical protein